ncbi:MAG TPA: hypothetical protein VMA77_21230 [Solirubrobacteraceae bacterium]|nr:hypothetical protein [Solirubrobacteraceae bacterium]
MTAGPPALRTVAFGDLEGTAWGVGWFADPAGVALAALGGGAQATARPGLRLSAGADGDEWRLEGEGAALVVSPVGDAAPARSVDGEIEGFDQLCRIVGRFELDDSEQPVDCLGLRTWWTAPVDLERYESIRAVAAWFEPEDALALTAFRARKAKGHGGDAAAGAVITPEGSPAVEDPRLSTTYEAQGWPVRAGVELWLATPEDSEQQFPRRASGEATGPRVEGIADGGLELRAEPFRWHSRGRDGAGIYILARRR